MSTSEQLTGWGLSRAVAEAEGYRVKYFGKVSKSDISPEGFDDYRVLVNGEWRSGAFAWFINENWAWESVCVTPGDVAGAMGKLAGMKGNDKNPLAYEILSLPFDGVEVHLYPRGYFGTSDDKRIVANSDPDQPYPESLTTAILRAILAFHKAKKGSPE